MVWKHKPECTEDQCYCADSEEPDPVCDCGAPSWGCECEHHDYQEEDENDA